MFRLATDPNHLDECDATCVGRGAFEARLPEHKPPDDAAHDPQHRPEQMGPCGKEDVQPHQRPGLTI